MKTPKREAELRAALEAAEAALQALEADPDYQAELATARANDAAAEAALVTASNHHRETVVRRLAEARIETAHNAWHPDLIAALEKATGWTYDQREDLKAANAATYRDDPFTDTLKRVRNRFAERDPEAKSARDAIPYKQRNEAHTALSRVLRCQCVATVAVDNARVALADYLASRDERRAKSPSNESTKTERERDEARKQARKVLAEISDKPETLAW